MAKILIGRPGKPLYLRVPPSYKDNKTHGFEKNRYFQSPEYLNWSCNLKNYNQGGGICVAPPEACKKAVDKSSCESVRGTRVANDLANKI